MFFHASSRQSQHVALRRLTGTLSLVPPLLALLCVGCVDVTPPWDQVVARTGGSAGADTTGSGPPGSGTGGTLGAGGTSGAGGLHGSSADGGRDAATGGAAPTYDAGDLAPGSGGTAGTSGGSVPDAPLGSGGSDSTGGRIDGALARDAAGGVDGGGASDSPAGTGGAALDGGGGSSSRSGGAVGSGGLTGTGGQPGSGGRNGTGGTTQVTRQPYDCANAIAPANGVVTSFADWDEASRTWGATSPLYGSIFSYADSRASFDTASVEGSPRALHLTGTVSGGYGGGGLSFWVCTTVASFASIQFDVYGSAPGCSVQMQIQLFDQRPVDQTPPGGCYADAGTGACFRSPALNAIVDLSSAIPATAPKTVAKRLDSFTDNTSWSAKSAPQVVGLQWQLAGSSCTADLYITNVKFTNP